MTQWTFRSINGQYEDFTSKDNEVKLYISSRAEYEDFFSLYESLKENCLIDTNETDNFVDKETIEDLESWKYNITNEFIDELLDGNVDEIITDFEEWYVFESDISYSTQELMKQIWENERYNFFDLYNELIEWYQENKNTWEIDCNTFKEYKDLKVSENIWNWFKEYNNYFKFESKYRDVLEYFSKLYEQSVNKNNLIQTKEESIYSNIVDVIDESKNFENVDITNIEYDFNNSNNWDQLIEWSIDIVNKTYNFSINKSSWYWMLEFNFQNEEWTDLTKQEKIDIVNTIKNFIWEFKLWNDVEFAINMWDLVQTELHTFDKISNINKFPWLKDKDLWLTKFKWNKI